MPNQILIFLKIFSRNEVDSTKVKPSSYKKIHANSTLFKWTEGNLNKSKQTYNFKNLSKNCMKYILLNSSNSKESNTNSN